MLSSEDEGPCFIDSETPVAWIKTLSEQSSNGVITNSRKDLLNDIPVPCPESESETENKIDKKEAKKKRKKEKKQEEKQPAKLPQKIPTNVKKVKQQIIGRT